jgi:hypothetical protein
MRFTNSVCARKGCNRPTVSGSKYCMNMLGKPCAEIAVRGEEE